MHKEKIDQLTDMFQEFVSVKADLENSLTNHKYYQEKAAGFRERVIVLEQRLEDLMREIVEISGQFRLSDVRKDRND